jgi:general secretion pathway protein D
MKKLPVFLILLCVVSCSQTKPKPKLSELHASAPAAGLLPNNSPTGASPASPTEQQFNPARTNATPFTPVEETAPAPRTATNAPTIVASTSSPAPDASEEIIPAGTINFPATDLKDVLQIYSELVNRTLLRPANLGSPQITLKTQTPLTKKEAIMALDAVFALNGISMINIGDKFVKVVPQAQVNTEGAPRDLRDASELPDLGQYVTHIVQLKYVKPSEMVPALAPFAKLNSILPIDTSMILIIRDYTENVKRMLEMVAQIDINVPSEFESEVIPIKYAKASEMADALNSLGAGGGGGGGGGSVGSRGSSTRGATRPGSAAGGFNRPGGMGGMGGLGGLGGAGNTPYGGATTPGMVGGTAGGGASFTQRLNDLVRKASTSGDLQLFGQMKMIADERSNSLLVFATHTDMEMIKSVIAKLDVVLAQVLIETLILDVQIGSGWNYGISAGQPPRTLSQGSNVVGTIGGVANNSGNPLGSLANFFNQAASGSNSSGIFPSASGLTYFGRYTGNIDLAVQAAASDSRVNVLQRPQILTTHATPGSIFVGSTVPYVTASSYGGAYGAGNSYQQLQVGIGLNVTPYINQDGLVVMQIDETIDEISGSLDIANVGAVPTTTHRALSAEVAVRDGETIILGGFIRNSDNKSSSGVPILQNIPLLGALFKSKSDTKARNELLVLMRPTVLRTPEVAAVHTTKMKKGMPGVMRAEAEVQADEQKQLDEDRNVVRAEQKKALKRKEKLTPEEKAYDDSQPK